MAAFVRNDWSTLNSFHKYIFSEIIYALLNLNFNLVCRGYIVKSLMMLSKFKAFIWNLERSINDGIIELLKSDI